MPHISGDWGIVSRATPVGNAFKLRVVYPNGEHGGMQVEPSREDGYLALLRESGLTQ